MKPDELDKKAMDIPGEQLISVPKACRSDSIRSRIARADPPLDGSLADEVMRRASGTVDAHEGVIGSLSLFMNNY
jgi:hypothetical protein